MIKVMCFGTFDVLHPGHVSYFQQAKKYGTHLIVVIARDKTKENEGKDLLFNENMRKTFVQKLSIVDEAVLGDKKDHFKIIQKKNPDFICLGYDHKISEKQLESKLAQLNLNSKVKRMHPYNEEFYKSSKIKENIKK